jgi:hypothetical protein
VVARHADGPASDVGAHTVADIRAGVLEGAGPARVR